MPSAAAAISSTFGARRGAPQPAAGDGGSPGRLAVKPDASSATGRASPTTSKPVGRIDRKALEFLHVGPDAVAAHHALRFPRFPFLFVFFMYVCVLLCVSVCLLAFRNLRPASSR